MQLNKALKNRWSPRAFSEQAVSDEMLELMFEAARWAPSAMNEQPWHFYYVRKENTKIFNDILNILVGINPGWAKNSQVLIISVLKKNYDYQNRSNRNAMHDIGAANVSIGIQAAEMGLQIHPMAGFDQVKMAEYLKLNTESFEPVTVLAVGFPGDPNQLTEELKLRELQTRTRKPISEIVTNLAE